MRVPVNVQLRTCCGATGPNICPLRVHLYEHGQSQVFYPNPDHIRSYAMIPSFLLRHHCWWYNPRLFQDGWRCFLHPLHRLQHPKSQPHPQAYSPAFHVGCLAAVAQWPHEISPRAKTMLMIAAALTWLGWQVKAIWGVPGTGVPQIIHFNGIFPNKNHPFGGTPMAMETSKWHLTKHPLPVGRRLRRGLVVLLVGELREVPAFFGDAWRNTTKL